MKNLNKVIVIVMMVFILCSTVNSQNLVALQSGANASFYTTIDAAVAAASSGDFIYIPGGVWSMGAIVHKGVNFVGVGYNSDSSSATSTTRIVWNGSGNELMISSGSDNGSCTGIQFLCSVMVGGDNQIGPGTISTYSFSRCRFSGNGGNNTGSVCMELEWSNNQGGVGNLFMSENVFDSRIEGYDISNVTFVKNIFSENGSNWAVDHVQSSQFWNNIFLQRSFGEWLFHHTFNNSYDNNIFLFDANNIVYAGEGNTGNVFNNNIFSDAQYNIFGSIDFNSTWGVDQSTIFTNLVSNVYDDHSDYTLQTIYLGNDLTQVGIYGTAVPFKTGALPFNPHIQLQSIGTSTDSQGHLPVHINVAAQGN